MSYSKIFRPTHILKIYHGYNYEESYIEVHEIACHNGRYIEKAGKPLTMDSYRKLFMLSAEKNDITSPFKRTLIDPRILSVNPSKINRHVCWYDIAKKRTLHISDKFYTLWMPAVLYYLKANELQIYALRDNKRPELYTKLYRFPTPNMRSESNFCWGSIDTSKKASSEYIDEEMEQWEDLVWNTQFDHYNAKETIKIIEELDKTEKRYPKSKLRSISKTLKNILP